MNIFVNDFSKLNSSGTFLKEHVFYLSKLENERTRKTKLEIGKRIEQSQ